MIYVGAWGGLAIIIFLWPRLREIFIKLLGVVIFPIVLLFASIIGLVIGLVNRACSYNSFAEQCYKKTVDVLSIIIPKVILATIILIVASLLAFVSIRLWTLF